MTFAPVADAPVVSLWPATTTGMVPGVFLASDLPGDTLWAVEISAPLPQGAARAAVWGMVAAMPVSSIGLPADLPATARTVRVSDRGWLGEPGDPDAPNQAWPARLIESPSVEMGIPIYPGDTAAREVTAGEITLANADGGLDSIAGDWALSGLDVIISRGPHRRPLHAARSEIGRVANMRVASALSGGNRLRLTMRSATADLRVPVCSLYDGTGGQEGPAALKGQAKPRIYGIRRSMAPVLVDSGRLIYQMHDGPMQAVVTAWDRGVRLTANGDVASYAALAAATVAGGTYQTCLASGHIRLGSTPSLLSVDAQGDRSDGYALSAAAIASRLLRGPGGLSPERAYPESFAAWPTGDAGMTLLGGTVADAMGRLAAGVGGRWGADAFGSLRGGLLTAPEGTGAGVALAPWMLAAPPEEDGQSQPPWWRARVGYQTLDRVLTTDEVAGAATGDDRDFLTLATRQAVSLSLPVQAAYRGAVDADIVSSVFDAQADAQAMADRMMALYSPARRAWRVRIGARVFAPQQFEPGAFVSLTWPVAGLSAGRPLVVRDLSMRGDVLDTVMWG